MITLPSGVQAALAARALRMRDFVRFTVKDRSTGAPYSEGYWSGVRTRTEAMIDPDTGSATSYSFFGAGQLIQIEPIPRQASLTVQETTLRLSGLADRVQDLIRLYDPRFGRVVIWRGLYDLTTDALVTAGFVRFVGVIDRVEVPTPAEGEEGDVTLTLVSDAVQFTRSNTALRSDADQRLRSATDNFFADVATIAQQAVYWGRRNGKIGVTGGGPPKGRGDGTLTPSGVGRDD